MYMDNFESDECSSRGTCTTPPNIAALEEIIYLLVKKSAYYLLKLKNLNIDVENVKYELINYINVLAYVSDYCETQLYKFIQDGLKLVKFLKELYIEKCEYPELICDIPIYEETSMPRVISFGESVLRVKYSKPRGEYKNLVEILFMTVKSASLNLYKLSKLNYDIKDNFWQLISAILLVNEQTNIDEIKQYIIELSKLTYNLQVRIGESLKDIFGEITTTEVSYSSTSGKAILVSGNNFFQLYDLLEETKDKNLDIYTHSELLISHCMGKFKKFPHLKGHYGNNFKSPIMDFGTFPGAILLTENSPHIIDYYYRGRIYSSDNIDRKGVMQINDNDLSPLIKSALEAKGFSSGKIKHSEIIGYTPDSLEKLFSDIASKLDNNFIKKIYVIWVNSYSASQEEYITSLFNSLHEDEIAISLYYKSDRNNVYTFNMGQSIPMGINMLNKLFEKYPLCDRYSFIITTCDEMTFSDVIYLNDNGVRDIYISSCPPAIIHPLVLSSFKKLYNIKSTTVVEEDLRSIRA